MASETRLAGNRYLRFVAVFLLLILAGCAEPSRFAVHLTNAGAQDLLSVSVEVVGVSTVEMERLAPGPHESPVLYRVRAQPRQVRAAWDDADGLHHQEEAEIPMDEDGELPAALLIELGGPNGLEVSPL